MSPSTGRFLIVSSRSTDSDSRELTFDATPTLNRYKPSAKSSIFSRLLASCFNVVLSDSCCTSFSLNVSAPLTTALDVLESFSTTPPTPTSKFNAVGLETMAL